MVANNVKIVMDTRWAGPHGIGRFAAEMYARIAGVQALSARTGLFSPADPIRLAAELHFSKAKVFFSPGFNAPLWERIPIVLTVHDLNYIHCRENSDALRRAYFRAIVRPACRRAFRVLTVSEFSKRQIIDWAGLGEDLVTNVGVGVDPAFNPDGARYDPGFPYLLAIGSTRAHKNIFRLIQAFGASNLNRDVRLLIVGQVDRQSEALLSKREYSSAVRLLGYVAESELPSLYRGATALCMPSLFEGFGLPVLEAMASGIPVVTSNVTALPETTGEYAVLVDPRDVESIALGLESVVTDIRLRQELIREGLERSQGYSWDLTAGKVARILDQAAEYGSDRAFRRSR